jgi:hypothetical protein
VYLVLCVFRRSRSKASISRLAASYGSTPV